MFDQSNLIYAPYWFPPYHFTIENFSQLLTNEIVTAQRRNPEFLYLDFDADEMNQEQTEKIPIEVASDVSTDLSAISTALTISEDLSTANEEDEISTDETSESESNAAQ